jgi:hypothetical protein
MVAEALERRWLAMESVEEYVRGEQVAVQWQSADQRHLLPPPPRQAPATPSPGERSAEASSAVADELAVVL